MREVQFSIRSILKRMNQRNLFEAKLHGLTIEGPSEENLESDARELSEDQEKMMKEHLRMIEARKKSEARIDNGR